MKNQHFVAFRTWPISCPFGQFLGNLCSVGRRLVACALGWNLPAAKLCSPAPRAAWAGRSPRRWPRAARSCCSAPARREALEELAAELPGEGHRVLPADLAEPGAAEKLAAEAGEVDILVANAGLPGAGRLHGLQRRGGDAGAAGQPRGADADGAGALPGDGRARLGPPRLHLLALRQGAPAPAPRSTTRPSSACAASPSACAPTSARRGSASRSSRPGFIRDAGMFADAGAKPPPGMGTGTPEQVGAAVVKAIERDKVELAVAPLQPARAGPLRPRQPRASPSASQSGVGGPEGGRQRSPTATRPDKR